MVENEVCRFQCEQIRKRIGLFAGEAFNRMAQSINACRRSDLPRQIPDHLRIEDDVICCHFGIDDADFNLFLRNSDNRVKCHFRACSCCRRNHHAGDNLFGKPRIVQKVFNFVFICRKDRGEFRRVHNGTAANRDDEIRSGSFEFIYIRLNLKVARLRCKIIENNILLVCRSDLIQNKIQQPRTCNSLIRKYSNFSKVRYDFPDFLQTVISRISEFRHL